MRPLDKSNNQVSDGTESGAALSRRSLLRNTAAMAAGTVLLGSDAASGAATARFAAPQPGGKTGGPLAGAPEAPPRPIRGVNLGNWLVLEKWIAPRVFAGVRAGDEHGLCLELGAKAARTLLERHWDTWIVEEDFAYLASVGINAVRLPVGYWVLGGEPPYVAGPAVLDRAFAWARKHNLRVVLDLHGAPGSQNGNDHSGQAGPIEWTKPENIAHTLRVLENLADRYKNEPSLWALELLNEPSWSIPIPTLKTFYQDAYHRLRRSLPANRVAIMFHDGFRPMEWGSFMNAPDYENVILDTHPYQCFTQADRERSAAKHLEVASVGRSAEIAAMQKQLPVTVGEWSLGLSGEAFAGLSPTGSNALKRAYAGAQLVSFDQAAKGWFFWTYKTESSPEWSLRESMKRGWMPEKFG